MIFHLLSHSLLFIKIVLLKKDLHKFYELCVIELFN